LHNKKDKTMSEIITRLEVDCSTGIATEIPLTAEELTQRGLDAKAAVEAQAIRDAETQALADLKASAIAALVAGTPLTPEQAATIVV
jgi:hypothetical protein